MSEDLREEEGVRPGELTAFQHGILLVLAEESRYGLAIKDELEAYYGTEINHGRLYPNLHGIAEDDLIENARSTTAPTATSSPRTDTNSFALGSSGSSRRSSPTAGGRKRSLT